MHDGRAAGWLLSMGAVAVLCAGCVNDAEVVGACTPRGDAQRVLLGPSGVEVGVLDGRVLISWAEPTSRVGPDGNPEYEWHAAWLDPLGALEGEVFLGYRRRTGGEHWVRDRDGLTTQSGLSTSDELVPVRLEDAMHLVRVTEAGGVEVTRVELPITRARPPDCEFCSVAGYGAPGLPSASDLLFPMLSTERGALAAVSAVPSGCGSYFADAGEPILFGWTSLVVRTREPCAEPIERWPIHLALVARGDSVGILHRVGDSAGQGVVHYLAVDESGAIVVPQVVVGAGEPTSGSDSGYDLHAVPLGEHHVLYRELSHGNRDDGYELCYRLRAFRDDGTEPGDIPFQLACMHSDRVTRSARLVELAGGDAALAWAERPRLGRQDNLTQITRSTPWDEGIYLTMIRPDGRRGSDIVRVTSDESTIMGEALDRRTDTSGPYPGDMTVSAASEGNRVVLAWRDERVDAPGIYVRSYTCERFAE